MNQSDSNMAADTSLRIIRNLLSLGRADVPRPVFLRLAWFCLGALLVLASVRTGHQGMEASVDADGEAAGPPSPREEPVVALSDAA